MEWIKGIGIVLVVLSVLGMLAGGAQAGVSLGSAQGSRSAEVIQGGETRFKILLFNLHEPEGLGVSMDVEEKPDGFYVDVEPDDFNLAFTEPGDNEPVEGYEFVVTSLGVVRARVVNVDVEVPGDAEPGEYTVKVYATAGGSGGMMATSQKRAFEFSVIVPGDGGGGEEPGDEVPAQVAGESQKGDGGSDTGWEGLPVEESPEEERPAEGEYWLEERQEEVRDAVTGMVAAVGSNPYLFSVIVVLLTSVVAVYLWRRE